MTAREHVPAFSRCLSVERVGQLLRLRVRLAVGVHGDGGDDLILLGLVGHHVPGLVGDGVHHLQTVHHAAEGGVLAVQMGRVLVHDEELASGAVRRLGAGHGQHAAGVAQVVVEAVGLELALDAVARAAHAVAVGAAALDHEAGDPLDYLAVREELCDLDLEEAAWRAEVCGAYEALARYAVEDER